ncbi:MAG TPA: hypothetical protein VFD36_20435 [Kofleriaceae bacterium]|nr:hypothetical protein [Kofleriaceae bacterium]
MADPVVQKTWTIGANNQIVFVSLNQTQGAYLKGMADFLLAHGYTCKGSSDGAAAAMDGVNRWVTVANASTRGANTAAANSWMCLTDGNGCDLVLSYVGATDDIARISFSGRGIYAAAGTATFTPTATDEVVILSTTTIGATASLDRWWFGWVDSTSKLCRFLIMRSAVMQGSAWGLELGQSRVTITWSPAVVGWSCVAGNFTYSYGTGFLDVALVGGIFIRGGPTAIRGGNMLMAGGAANMVWTDVITENQGSVGYQIAGPLSMGATTAGKTGPLIRMFDLWGQSRTGTAGDTWNTKKLATFSGTRGILFPWDGATNPNVGGGAPGTQTGQAFGFENDLTEAYGSWLSGANMYVPLANSAVTPTGPTAARTISRRPGVDVIRINNVSTDPPAETGHTLLYSRIISGSQALFARYPDGTVEQVGAD